MRIIRPIKKTIMFIVILFISIYNAHASNNFFVVPTSTTQNQTQPISIPLTMNNLSNVDIRSIELNIAYDPAVLTATGLSLTGTVLENQNYLYEFNTGISGIIYAVFASNASHYTGTGLCLNLEFTVIGTSGDTSDISISTAIVNNLTVTTSNGLFTVAPDSPPIFTGITPQTINEDASLSTSLTINDYESNPCELTITIESSDENIVSANTISYTCISGSYSFFITPASDQNGLVTITITAEDSIGQTSSESFDLTVVSVNDAPSITANTTLSMNEDSSSAFSLTAADIETAGCSMDITWNSSDISILPDDHITKNCTGDVFYFSLTPVENQSGNLTVSFTITDAGGLTAAHTLDLTITPINDTPLIGIVANQSTDNRTALSSISITATDIETAACSMNLSLTSSDTNIFASSNMTYNCSVNTFYMSFTPSMQYFGTTTITAMVTDSEGLTASTTFDIDVSSTGPNYAPVLGVYKERWLQINPRTPEGLWGADENNYYIVGNRGEIFHYNGSTLTPMYSGIGGNILKVWGTSPVNVYAVGEYGLAMHYDGRTWEKIEICPNNYAYYGIGGLDENNVYAVGYSGYVCHYDGSSWTQMTGTNSWILYSIWGSSSSDLYVSAPYLGLYYNGSTWTYSTSINAEMRDIWGIDSSNIWQVGLSGKVYYYNGSTWNDQTISPTYNLEGIWGSDSNNIFAVGQQGSIRKYNGSAWTDISTVSDSFIDVWGSDANQVYALTQYGEIFEYTSTTFNLDYQSITTNIYGIWVNSSTDIFISANAGRVFHFNGTNWTKIIGSDSEQLNAIWSDGSIAWAASNLGRMFYYDGSTLDRDTSFSGSALHDVWGTASNDVFAVGESGTIRYYDGSSWSLMNSGTSVHLYGIHGTASNNVIAVGAEGTILRYTGTTWSADSIGVTVTLNGVWANNTNDIYVVGNSGTVLHYDGSSWQLIDKISGRNLNDVWGNGTGDVYIVGEDSNILHYNGTLWTSSFDEYVDLYDISGYSNTVMTVGESRTIRKLGDYDFSSTITQTISMNSSNAPISIQLKDYNNDSTTVSAISSNQSILPDINISITGSGDNRTILLTPVTDQYGSLTLTVSVDDGLSQTTTDIYLYVSQPPVISTIAPQNMDEDTILNLSLPVTGVRSDECKMDIRAFSSDEDIIRELQTDCDNGNYTLTITPVPSQSGTTTITITALDINNAYTEQSFSLTVNPINDPPKIGVSSDQWTAPMRRIQQVKSFSDGSVVATSNVGKIYHYVNQQWRLEPSESTGSLNAIWGLDANNIYVGGFNGKIIHFDGNSWIPDTSNTTNEIFGIWGSAANDIFAVCQSGKIVHYDGTWSLMESTTTNYLYDVDGNASDDVYACGQSGTIIHYNGTSWSPLTSGTATNLDQIMCMGTNAIFAKGNYEILYYNGSSWSIYTAANTVQDLWGISSNDVYAVCSGGKIYHFDGSSWSEMNSSTTQNLMAIWGKSAADIYAVGNGVIIHYDGFNWSEMQQNLNQNLTHVTGTNNEIFAASYYGIYKNNGINWSETTMDNFWKDFVNSSYIPAELKVMSDGRIIGANSSYFIQYSGTVWTFENTGISLTVKDIWSDGTEIFIAGNDGKIVHYDGASWAQLTTGTTLDFYGIWGTRKNNLYIAAESGTVFHYDGTSFTSISLDTTNYFNTIWGSGFSDIYVGGYQGFFHYNGQEWEKMDPGVTNSDSVIAMYGRHSRDIYIAGSNGKISHNNGFCWSSLTTGTTSQFRTIWLQKADEIYAGGDTGLLAQSDGQAFTFFDPLIFSTYTDIDGGEDYVITGGSICMIRYAPVISIPDQTLYADSLVHNIPFVVNDSDGDSVMVSVTPSSLTLLSADSISISGTGPSYSLLITPTVYSFLPITITISAYDGSLTQNENFMLYLRKPNEAPELAIIPNLSTAAGEISFTFVETDGDTVSLTVTSSDQSLINDANIQIVGGTGNTIILPTDANVEQSVTIHLNQENNVHGIATITIEASAVGGNVTETFNVIVSPPGSGNALAFDGDDDFVTLGSISGSHPLAFAGSHFSMSFWIKPSFNNSVSQRLIDKSTNTYGTDGYSLYLYSGNRMRFSLNGQDRFTTDMNSLIPNIWQHVVITADASQYKCYVNGMPVSLTYENSFELPPNATANLYLGTWYSESGREFNGEMDEVSLWNRALSETDIRDIMCHRLIGTENGLVAYYRFDHVSGTVLNDLSGNNYHGTLTNMDNTDWIISGAALGDTSTYDYTGSIPSDFSVTISHSDGDAFTAFGDSGSYSGLQIYLVNESPSSYTAPAGFSGLYTDHYFGVFPVGVMPTYSISYNYTGNSSIVTESGLRLASRNNNTSTWIESTSNVNINTTTMYKNSIAAFSGISTTEFIPGRNEEPLIGNIAEQTINEDTILESFSITVSDAETADCELNITFVSSNESLISSNNISYTCLTNAYYLTITPTSNIAGMAYISITVTDEGGLTASNILAITVSEINDAPLISSISGQTTSEDTSINTINFTASDSESISSNLIISTASSDPTLVTDITYVCDNNMYTLTINPVLNQYGIATISVTITDEGGLTATTAFDLTITSVNDAPDISEFYTEQQGYDTTLIDFNTTSDLTNFFNPDSASVFTNESTGGLNGSGVVSFSSATETWTLINGFTQTSGATFIIETYFYNEWNSGWTGIGFASSDQNEPAGTAGDPSISIGVGFHGGGGAFLNNGSSANISWSPDLVSGNWYKMIYTLTNNGDNTFDEIFEIYNSDVSGTVGSLKTSHTQSGTTNTNIAQANTIYAYFSNSGSRMSAMDEFLAYADTGSEPVILNEITVDEDNIADSILFTVADVDGDNLTLSVNSSNLSIVAIENIEISGTGSSRTLTITPTANESGVLTITIAITDGNLTTTTELPMTVNSINDQPIISSIADQTTLEDIATGIISFTATDFETAASSLILTMTSSDQTLVPDEYLIYESNAGQYSIVATPAFNQYGTVAISVTIIDSGGLAASTTFNLTVTDVDDSIYMWANNQAADVVLGQSDFISNASGATSSSFFNPSAIAVDQRTGKVFVSDRNNNRILRFSSIAATIDGSSAEAVFGQADFTSNLANRGGSVAANTLDWVDGIWVDSFGHLWAIDRNNNRILRFNNASSKASGSDADGVLGQSNFTTISSGTNQNQFDWPSDICIDPAGRLWVADYSNNRILRFDDAVSKLNGANADGVLGQSDFNTATSGMTQNTFNTPNSVFVNNSNTLFVVDIENFRVLGFNNAYLKSNGANADRVLGQTDYVSNTYSTSNINIKRSVHAIIDNTGRLYLSDYENNRILIFNDVLNKANGASADYVLGQPDFISSTANNGGISERTMYGPHWMYFDNSNNCLWVADFTNNRVLRYTMMIKTSPVMSLISDSNMNEDTVSNAISFTVTDINEQALTISYQSSNTSLISTNNITFTGDYVSTDGSSYTVSAAAVPINVTLNITPETNQSGTSYITITVTDPDGMTSTKSFVLTVNPVNDVPVMSTINPQNLNEGTAIEITLTTSDIEGDALSLTVVSADQSLIQDSDILLSNDGSMYTITITPLVNQSGSTDITVSISDGTDITSMTFMITVNEVYYIIAGHVSYYTDIAGSNLEGVTMTLAGTHSYTIITDVNGYYTFTTVRPGDYTLTASKSDDISLNLADAIKILNARAQKISLTCLEQIAADAYNDGYYCAYDAAKIAHYIAGYSNCLNDSCTFWQFVTENITSCETWPLIEFESTRRYTDLTGDALGQDFIGIGCGNVSE